LLYELVTFISSQEILEKFTPRQLRLAFLTQLWNAKIDFSESLMTGEVRNLEITFNVCTSSFVVWRTAHPVLEFLYHSKGPYNQGKFG
jgi:cysteinyl-tRNA synthetase